MTCTACGDKPKNTAKDFTKAVIEIDNPECLTLLRKVTIPASMGDDTTNPPVVGKYKNVVMVYEATDNIYLYSSDGIPTKLTASLDELRIRVNDLEEYAEEETAARTSADEDLQDQIDEIRAASDVVDIVGTYAELEDYDTSKLTVDDIIKVLVDETKDDATTYYRWTGEEWEYVGGLGPFYTKDETDTLLDNEADAREAADADLQAAIDAEASARQDADDSLSSSLSGEVAARQAADTTLQNNIDAEASARTTADATLQGNIDEEETARIGADTSLRNDLTSLTTSLNNERTARQNSDTTLQNNIDAESTARQSADTALGNRLTTVEGIAGTALQPSAIDKVVMNDLAIGANPSTTTVQLDAGKVNLLSSATSTTTIPLPVASSTQAGVMNSATFDAVSNNTNNINALLNGAVAISGLPANPTQAQLTAAWENETGLTTLMNRAGIYDSTNQKVWTYYTNDTTWHAASNSSQVTINTFTNQSAGTILGSTNEGQVFAENDGTGSVNGWDTLSNSVATATSKLATIAQGAEVNVQSNWTETNSSSDAYILNKPTIPTVNDATLTIQKNGTNVQTFTANASSNKTANITVPTKTSDLTNDSNFPVDANYVHTDNNFTTTEKNKLAGIASGAEVNQNAFSNVKVGNTTVAADSKTDTLELAAGGNITLTPDATNDKVTVTGKQQTRTNDNLSPSSDTTAEWSSLFNTPSSTGVDHTKGPFVTYYNTQNCFSHQPSQYGFLETFVTGGNANIIQRWTNLVDGITLLRSGNQNGWHRANSNGGWERFSYGNQSTFYVTSTTAAGTAAKTADFVSGLNGKFKLETGVRVSVKFTNGNTYNGTATLNVDDTGATNIVYVGASTGTRYMWSAGEVVDFIYDGTNWVMVDGGLATTTYYGVTKLSDSVSSTSTSMAATPNSVKQAYDLASSKPDITMTDTDPGEGSPLAENNYIGVYGEEGEVPIIGETISTSGSNRVVQLQDEAGNNVLPIAGGAMNGAITTGAISDGAVTPEKLNIAYSTSEQLTGEKWIDGSPIYRKTINFGALPNAGDKSVAHGISGLNRVVLMTGYTRQPSSGRTRPLPPMTKSSNDLMDIYTEGANVTISTNNDWSPYTETYITLYYTKSS